jgi:predicted nucleotidyltransferase
MDQDLEKLRTQIIALVNPMKIILFGSRARGTSSEKSDYDILVIMPERTNKRETAQFLYRNIENVKISYDFIVATPDTIKKYSKIRQLIYYPALKDGEELYAA